VRVAGDIPDAVEECVLAALTDSVFLKCLSIGGLTPFSVSAYQSVDWLIGTLGLPARQSPEK
jgi:hypothetical protein